MLGQHLARPHIRFPSITDNECFTPRLKPDKFTPSCLSVSSWNDLRQSAITDCHGSLATATAKLVTQLQRKGLRNRS